jgi:hypothetical protein
VKRDYDVIGSGEGICGLFACAILASKGLTCLWVDNAPHLSGTELCAGMPLLMSTSFVKVLLGPILSRMDPHMMKALEPEFGLVMQLMDSNEVIVRPPGNSSKASTRAQKFNSKYFKLLRKSALKPKHYLKELQSQAKAFEPWEDIVGSTLSSPQAGRLAQLRAYSSTLGMSAVEHGKIKAALIEYVRRSKGDYLQNHCAALIVRDKEVLGMQLDENTCKGACYITEDPPGQKPYNGFYLYGQCRARLGMFPKGLGDLMVVSPPHDLKYPILLKVSRNMESPRVTVQTKVNLEPGLTSFTEIISWASGMVTKSLSRIMPYLSGPLHTLEVVNPMDNDTIRPWFRFSEDIKPPSLFRWRSYITPIERIYACDRDKYACLGNEGDFFWGICIANAILKDVGRSDLITINQS